MMCQGISVESHLPARQYVSKASTRYWCTWLNCKVSNVAVVCTQRLSDESLQHHSNPSNLIPSS